MKLRTKQYQHEILYDKTSETHFACEAGKKKIKLISVESSHTAEKKHYVFIPISYHKYVTIQQSLGNYQTKADFVFS